MKKRKASKSESTKGRRASIGGRLLEQAVSQLELCGFDRHDSPLLGGRCYTKNRPYTTLFGTRGRMEYWVNSPEFTGRLECKFQSVSGSVDEKLAMIVETLRRSRQFHGTIVLLGGEFWTDKERGRAGHQWLIQEAAALPDDKVLHPVLFTEFTAFCKKTWGP